MSYPLATDAVTQFLKLTDDHHNLISLTLDSGSNRDRQVTPSVRFRIFRVRLTHDGLQPILKAADDLIQGVEFTLVRVEFSLNY